MNERPFHMGDIVVDTDGERHEVVCTVHGTPCDWVTVRGFSELGLLPQYPVDEVELVKAVTA